MRNLPQGENCFSLDEVAALHPELSSFIIYTFSVSHRPVLCLQKPSPSLVCLDFASQILLSTVEHTMIDLYKSDFDFHPLLKCWQLNPSVILVDVWLPYIPHYLLFCTNYSTSISPFLQPMAYTLLQDWHSSPCLEDAFLDLKVRYLPCLPNHSLIGMRHFIEFEVVHLDEYLISSNTQMFIKFKQ